MGENSADPVDHSRTTRQHAGETMKNGDNAPGLAISAVGIVAMVLGLAAFATGRPVAGALAVGVAIVAGLVGAVWLYVAHRRVREKELRWAATHPQADAPAPTS